MNNATASLQSSVSFLLLTMLCSTISPSHMHTLEEWQRRKALLLLLHNIINIQNVFIVLPTGKNKCQCINEQKWFGFSDCAVCMKCLVLLLCLERVRTVIVGSMLCKVYTCCCSKSTPALNLKAGRTLELGSASVTGVKGSVWSLQRQSPA